MIELALAALLAAASQSDFRELKCTGVPRYPKGKRVLLTKGQIIWSATAEDNVVFVEPEAMTGVYHYEMRKTARKTLKGTATCVSSFDWKHQSSPATCKILR
jgi:hypothetical protein